MSCLTKAEDRGVGDEENEVCMYDNGKERRKRNIDLCRGEFKQE